MVTLHNDLELENQTLKAEVERLKNNQKYGLIWEDTPEKLDNPSIVPLLREMKDKRIQMLEDGEQNYLIEGDNYHALKALQHTHKGKVDVIYIDPPYNTGNEFVYNDKIVDKEDGYRHSKWLSFMSKRLKLAQRLLSDEGVIFVSIDDNEQAQLKLLMDSIFGENNFVNNFMWLHGKGKKTKQSRTMQQYILTYSKNKSKLSEWGEIVTPDYAFKNPDNDVKGEWFSGSLSFSENRSNKNHPNYFKLISPSGIEWTRQWFMTKEEILQKKEEGDIYFGNPPEYNNVPRLKIRKETIKIIPKNIIENKGTTSSAESELTQILGEDKFDYPKPKELIKHLITIVSGKNDATVLDFFAGSGTTGHAVLELNKEDGGNRKFILCTNNEVSEEKVRQHFMEKGLLDKNNKTAFNKFKKENENMVQEFIESEAYQELGIARSVTYERIRKVIEGYTTPKKVEVEGIAANLCYLETVEYERMGVMFPLIRNQVYDDVKNLHELAFPSTEYDNYYIQMYDKIEIEYKGKPITVLLNGNEKENELIIKHIAHLGHKNITYRAIENYI